MNFLSLIKFVFGFGFLDFYSPKIFGTISAGIGILSGVNSLMGGGGSSTSPTQASAAADPFAPYRPQYAEQLNQLMADPSKVASQPGYKAGMQVVERGLASHGQISSGNEQAALFDYGSGFFNQYLQQLMNLSGVNQNPSAGPQAASQALGNQFGTLNTIGSNLAGLFPKPTDNTSYANSLASQPDIGGYSAGFQASPGWYGR